MQSAARTSFLCLTLAILTGSTALGDDVAPLAIPPVSGGCFYGYGWMPWSLYAGEYIPYHALHPPVYYSYPVPRSYGYSPFAYPPGTPTPEVHFAPEPKVVPNHYVPQDAKVQATTNRVAESPLRIRNPFVAQTETGSGTQELATYSYPSGRSPQVVFPTRIAERP
jgi:hypothetical protein